jgi:hypothetical protein
MRSWRRVATWCPCHHRVMPTRAMPDLQQITRPCLAAEFMVALALAFGATACRAPATRSPVAPVDEQAPRSVGPERCTTGGPAARPACTEVSHAPSGDVGIAPEPNAPAEPARIAVLDLDLEEPSLPATKVLRPSATYKRREWKHWLDEDRDCQNTRTEVLVAESEVPVRFMDARRCKVLTGRWTCPYTGKVVFDPGLLDVDHVVALGNAARSGGYAWSPERKTAYANDVNDPSHLIAVDRSANQAKRDRGPEAWLPPRPEYQCTYVRTWVAIKKRWGLTTTLPERRAIASLLHDCPPSPAPTARAAAPSTPQRSRSGRPREPEATRPIVPSPTRCSTVCRTGCACGHGCIPCSRTCRRPPGRACASSQSARP